MNKLDSKVLDIKCPKCSEVKTFEQTLNTHDLMGSQELRILKTPCCDVEVILKFSLEYKINVTVFERSS